MIAELLKGNKRKREGTKRVPTPTIAVTIDGDIKAAVEEVADLLGYTLSGLCRQALGEFVERNADAIAAARTTAAAEAAEAAKAATAAWAAATEATTAPPAFPPPPAAAEPAPPGATPAKPLPQSKRK